MKSHITQQNINKSTATKNFQVLGPLASFASFALGVRTEAAQQTAQPRLGEVATLQGHLRRRLRGTRKLLQKDRFSILKKTIEWFLICLKHFFSPKAAESHDIGKRITRTVTSNTHGSQETTWKKSTGTNQKYLLGFASYTWKITRNPQGPFWVFKAFHGQKLTKQTNKPKLPSQPQQKEGP